MYFAVSAFMLAALAGCGQPESETASTAAPTPIANAANGQTAGDDSPVAKQAATIPQGSGFDFYVLALSWSPAYCDLKGRSADPAQCNASKPFRFIVHGLWPQFEQGYPQDCRTNGFPSRDDIQSIRDLTPSPGLVRYEWEKHGTCSGLSPQDYFTVMRTGRYRVVVPAQFNGSQAFELAPQAVETAFIRANKGLAASGIATVCEEGLLTEVRICFTKALEFRACPEVDGKSCRARTITIEPPQ
ncbi:MAG: ribonuclease T2 [Rhizobiaceae bacterium]